MGESRESLEIAMKDICHRLFILLFILLKTINSNKYGPSLVSNDRPLPSLRVIRNKFNYLKRIHLPIPTKVQQGQVCTVEVELNAPFYCSVGCLQPKKFPCSFNDGDVIYFHNGNPLINHDKVRVTIYYSRENHSILQSVDLNVSIEENPDDTTSTNDDEFYFNRNNGRNSTLMNLSFENSYKASSMNEISAIRDIKAIYQPFKSRLVQLKDLSVKTLRGVTQAINPNILSIKYDQNMEECFIHYHHISKSNWKTFDNQEDIDGQYSNTLRNQRFNSGDASQWPIFGNLIGFNRSIVNSFSMNCKEALLKGFRYIHKNIESPDTDYLPFEVNIYRRNFDGSKQLVSKQGIFLKVNIASVYKLRNPIIKAPREINLIHLGGTFSILPKDCLMVPVNSVPSEEFIDVNITKIEGNFNRQFVNLRDPSREIFSFKIADLRAGLIAFQLLDYAEKLVKTIGYLDDKHVAILVIRNFTSWPVKYPFIQKPKNPVGSITVAGHNYEEQLFVFQQIESGQVVYETAKGFCETVDRIKLSVLIKSTGFIDLSRRRRTTLDRYGRNIVRPIPDLLPKDLHSPLFELPVRMFRLYNHVDSSVLKSDYKIDILHRSFKCFSSEDLLLPEALTALRKDQVNVKFRITNKPTQGILVRSSTLPSYGQNAKELADIYRDSLERGMTNIPPYYDQSTIQDFTLEDLEDSEVCYINQRDDREFDLFGIKQIGNPDFKVFYFEVIVKKSVHMILKPAMNPSIILQTQDSANFVLITNMHLSYEIQDPNRRFDYDQNDQKKKYTTKDIIYRVTKMPYFVGSKDEEVDEVNNSIRDSDAGRIISLSEVQASDHVGDTNLQSNVVESLRKEQPPVCSQFTQAQIDSGDIVYVPPFEDIGFNVKNSVFEYSVSIPGTLGMFEKKLRIRILPEDNIAPTIAAKYPSLNATRDGELVLNEKYFEFADLDTSLDGLNVTFHEIPIFGKLIYYPHNNYIQEQVNFDQTWIQEKIKVNQTIPVNAFLQSKILYRQSGKNVKEDSFTISVSDGRQTSDKKDFLINIHQRVIEIPNWLRLVNNSILVDENSTVILHESIFPGIDDTGNEAITENSMRFIVVVKPTKGKILMDGDREISQFSLSDLRNEKISYQHGPAEIGWKHGNDFAKLYDLRTAKDFSINFALNPLNSQRPELKKEGILQVKEGGSAVLTTHHITIHDLDTPREELTFQLVSPPKWGSIVVNENSEVNLSPDYSESVEINNKIITFDLSQLKSGSIHYINGDQSKGVEVTDDVFTLKAYDKDFSSEPVNIQVVIQSTNDEMPYVRMLSTFSVPLGKKKVLTPHLFTFSDSDIPRDSLEVSFPKLPKYGDLYQYWRHGEKNIINVTTGPMLQMYLEMLNIVYVQEKERVNASQERNIVEKDYFTVQVSDGLHSIQRNSTVFIRRENNQEPTIKIIGDGLVLDGTYWKSLNDVIEVNDPDTVSEDLEILIESEPKLGKFKRMPRMDYDQEILEDKIEAAWDFEEQEALNAGHTQRSMTDAGSIGGPKTEKFLIINDRFTKRQLLLNRVHYVYNKNYTDNFIEDSCYLRVTDGKFTSERVELKIKIRKTHGYILQQSVQKSIDDSKFEFLRDEPSGNILGECFSVKDIHIAQEKVLFKIKDLLRENCTIVNDSQLNVLRVESTQNELKIIHKNCFKVVQTSKFLNDTNIEFDDCKQNFSIYLQVYKESIRPEIIKISVMIGQNLDSIRLDKDTNLIESFSLVDVNIKANSFPLRYDTESIDEKMIRIVPVNFQERFYKRYYSSSGIIIRKDPTVITMDELKNSTIWFSSDDEDLNKMEISLNFKIYYNDSDTGLRNRIRIFHSSLPSEDGLQPMIISNVNHLETFPIFIDKHRWALLNPGNIYHKNKLTNYTLLNSSQYPGLRFYNLKLEQNVTHFTQDDINKYYVCIIIDSGDSLNSQITYNIQPSFQTIIGSTFELNISWRVVSFERKRYFICKRSGILTMMVKKIDPKERSTKQIESYLKINVHSNFSRLIRLNYPDRVNFTMGDAYKRVPIRINIDPKLSETKKIVFSIDCYPKDLCICFRKYSEILITQKSGCVDRAYYQAFEEENQSDENMQADQPNQSMIKTNLIGHYLGDYMAKNNYSSLQEMITSVIKANSITSKGNCEKGWERYQDRCYRYYLNDEKIDWYDAHRFCTTQKGYLSSIRGLDEQKWIKLTFKAEIKYSKFTWIGLYKRTEYNEWTWDNGDYLHGYANWGKRYQQGGNKAHCGAMSMRRNRKWMKFDCVWKLRSFICMKNLIE